MKSLFSPSIPGNFFNLSELLALLTEWYNNASQKNWFYKLLEKIYPSLAIHMPDAIALATATADGKPSVRMVLYKGQTTLPDGRQGIVFYTNYDSRKSRELISNPHAAVVFHWPLLVRQVRLEGEVVRAPIELSDRYWKSRAPGSQAAGAASPQSQEIESFDWLRARVEQTQKLTHIPRPQNWGGYVLVPNRIEFWQGHAFRLHERAVFTLDNTTQTQNSKGDWKKALLGP